MNEKIDIGDKENKIAEPKRVEIIEMDELFSYIKKKKQGVPKEEICGKIEE